MAQKRKKVKKQVCSSNSWADLPDDLLDSILEKLVSVYDIIRFGFVCKPWNCVALIHKEKLIPLINHQPPWLFVNSVYRQNMVKPKSSQVCNKRYTIRKQRLFNFNDGSEILNLKLKIPSNYKHRQCFGSSYGWLFYKEIRNCVIVLINPISGTVIRLPPIPKSVVHVKDVRNFILSSDPCLGYFEVLATNYNKVAHLKFGDQFWTYSQNCSSLCLNSFAFYENWVLGVSNAGIIYYLDIIHSPSEFSQSIKYYKIPRDLNKVMIGNSFPTRSAFVKTTNGDLLIVHEYCYARERYRIFQIKNYAIGVFAIIPVVDLDGHCLFLKREPYHQCVSVLALNYPGCRANSIYLSSWTQGEDYISSYSEEFNLKDQSTLTKNKYIRIYPAGSKIDTVFWMVPSIKL